MYSITVSRIDWPRSENHTVTVGQRNVWSSSQENQQDVCTMKQIFQGDQYAHNAPGSLPVSI